MRRLLAILLIPGIVLSASVLFGPQRVYAAGISIDNTAGGFVSGSGGTFTMAIAGSNRLLLCSTQQDATGGDKVTAMDAGGSAMTAIGSGTAGPTGSNGFEKLWYVIAPPTGASVTITITAGASSNYYYICYSLNGAKQSAQPDASNYTANASTANHTGTVTVVATNSWVFQFTRTAGNTLSAGTNCTYETNTQPFGTIKGCDSNGPVAAGSYSITQTSTADADAIGTVSIAPAPATATFAMWEFFPF